MDPLRGRNMGQRRIKVNSTPFSSAEDAPTGFKGKRKPHETFIRAWLAAVGDVGPMVLILSSAQCSNEAPSPAAGSSPRPPRLLRLLWEEGSGEARSGE